MSEEMKQPAPPPTHNVMGSDLTTDHKTKVLKQALEALKMVQGVFFEDPCFSDASGVVDAAVQHAEALLYE